VVWGSQWEGKTVQARCDNSAVVAVLNARTCRDRDMMQLVRCLFFFEAVHQFACHILGTENIVSPGIG